MILFRFGDTLQVQSSQQVRVVLDLDLDGEPIRGSVCGADQGIRPFFGWLELANALVRVREFAVDAERSSSPKP